jgi:large subunit ribosomal protein L15
MDLSRLKPAEGSTKTNKRLGRGQGSGNAEARLAKATRARRQSRATTASAASRAARCPLARRLPKFGFTNPTRVEYKGINLDALQALATAKNLKRDRSCRAARQRPHR